MNNCKIAIIGGGIAGLGTLKELKEVGVNDVTLFEYFDEIGGNWNPNNDKCGGYKGMISNSSYTVWPYSDYIYDIQNYGFTIKNHPKFTKIEHVYQHLVNYANHFNLYQNIQLNSEVVKIRKNNISNKWDVHVLNTKTNNININVFDKVVLCIGTYRSPQYPSNFNQIKANFKGEIYHSRDMKQVKSFKNKKVLVVGNSVSASDVVEYASMNNAEHVYNIYREPRLLCKWFRTDNDNINVADHTMDSVLMARNSKLDPSKYALYLEKYGFITPNDIATAKLRFCFGLEYFCKTGLVTGIHGEIEYAENNNVYLKNYALNNIDIIIFATGYYPNGHYNKILSKNIINRIYKPEISRFQHLLYLLTFIPGYEQDNIAFNGANSIFNQTALELQARLIAQVWNGNVKLDDIDKQQKWIKDTLIDNDPLWYTPSILPFPYMDDIAECIGILPKKKDFPAEYQYIYEKLKRDYGYPSQFRVVGPGSNDQIKSQSIKMLAKILAIDKRESKFLQAQVCGIPFAKLYSKL